MDQLLGTGRLVLWSFRSKYKKFFRTELETRFFYPTKDRSNSLFLKRKGLETK